jgi:hypothetical protein
MVIVTVTSPTGFTTIMERTPGVDPLTKQHPAGDVSTAHEEVLLLYRTEQVVWASGVRVRGMV